MSKKCTRRLGKSAKRRLERLEAYFEPVDDTADVSEIFERALSRLPGAELTLIYDAVQRGGFEDSIDLENRPRELLTVVELEAFGVLADLVHEECVATEDGTQSAADFLQERSPEAGLIRNRRDLNAVRKAAWGRR